MKSKKNQLTEEQSDTLLSTLKARFTKHMNRHQGLSWDKVEAKLEKNPDKLWSLNEMEKTGGEPDVVGQDKKTGAIVFYDCAPESPKGRRSICYDGAAQAARKKFAPDDNAVDMGNEMGIELLSEEEYMDLQKLGPFDTKTSVWLKTPPEMRKLGGGLTADYRFGRVFIGHNGADSYYASRGFRGKLLV